MEDGFSVNPHARGGMSCPSVTGCLIFFVCLALFTSGCNRSAPRDSDSSSDDTQSGSENVSSPRKTVKSKDDSGKGSDNKDAEDGRKYVGGIPLDVWFDDPLTIARNTTPVGGAPVGPPDSPPSTPPAPPTQNVGTKTAPGPATTSPPAGPPDAAVAAGDWKSLISGELISDETKAVRAQINTSLQTVSKYNGNYKEIQVETATLSALAVIASAHPDSINWKKDAPFVRDLAINVGKQAKGLAQPNYDNTRRAFERLDGLLSGNRPPDLGKAEPKLPFPEVASRGPLMRRMARAFEMLRSNINTEAALKSSADKVVHEATILATLTQVVAADGYTDADQADYQKFIKELVQASRKASAAAKDGDFAAFTDAMSKGKKACDMCHQNFRFSNE